MPDFLHKHPQFADLIRIVARDQSINPSLLEKDYWIMHCLYGLQQLQMPLELKGGTSLSKGFQIIERFSEDIHSHRAATRARGQDGAQPY
jgi:predicted nucleotidyltransferase component of viral defense system